MNSFPTKRLPHLLRDDRLYLIVIFLTLTCLSFVKLSAGTQVLAVFGGLVLPLFCLVRFNPAASLGEIAPYSRDSFLYPGTFLFFLMGGLALWVRVAGLTNLLVWPQADEGFSGIAAIELSRKWDWRFFYSDGQSPPTLDWICSLFFKGGHSYFFNLWFPPAVLSILTLSLGILAARQLFSPTFSLLFAGLLAFSFWPLYLGRLCLQVGLMPPWEMGVLWAWGRLLKAPASSRFSRTALLGLVAGLGAYTYVPWVFVPLLLALFFLAPGGTAIRTRIKNSGIFLFFTLLGASFFIFASLREGYGDHISSLWAVKTAFSPARQAGILFDYLNILFWGYVNEVPRYVPFRGGFLNPLLGSLFFLGAAEVWRNRAKPWARATVAAFFLFLLPGVLSSSVQGLRITLLLPVALFITGLGFQRLTERAGLRSRLLLALLLLASTLGWDFARLVQPYRDPSRYADTFPRIDKNPVLFRAYQVLCERFQKEGQGLVFSDFTPERDQTLRGAVYPFNALWNGEQTPGKCAWAAVLTEERFRRDLSRRFPTGKWVPLQEGVPGERDKQLLLLDLSKTVKGTLLNWGGVPFRYFQGLSSSVNEVKNQATYDEALRRFTHPPSDVVKDPFLRDCWKERLDWFYGYFGKR